VDVILPDICRAGGISEGRRIATVASLHNTRWAAHVSMGSSIHVAAAAHLAAASANFLIFEFSSTPNPIGEELLTAPLHPEMGRLCVPDGPGLGIAFDESRLRAHLLDEQKDLQRL
jgi:D-arabinonate dehydratase/D-galactarolactone cycloisomerase